MSNSGKRRMFSVWSTEPMFGIARYPSRCSWLFHWKVPTRSPASMPRRWSAPASCPARPATSANVARREPSPSKVTTSLSPYTAWPWRRIIPIVSGKSCIVLSSILPPRVQLSFVALTSRG
jgi:hypothetical protein